MVGIAGAGAEAVALHAGARIGPSVLDLVAGWSLLLAAALGSLLQPGCRRTVVIAAGLWFAGTPADIGGELGRVASHGAAFYLAPLTVALWRHLESGQLAGWIEGWCCGSAFALLFRDSRRLIS